MQITLPIPPDIDADEEVLALWTQPQPRKGRAAPSRRCGRISPKVVNFKSPPKAIVKSSRVARQAVVSSLGTCMSLSDKAAAAHVEAMNTDLPPRRFQEDEPTESLRSVEPKAVSPPALSAHLWPSNSDPSLNSLLGDDDSELEGLGSPLSSRCGSGATELIQLSRRAGGDTPPGGPASLETSDKTSRCHAPQMMRISCLSSSASSSFTRCSSPAPSNSSFTRCSSPAPQATRPPDSSSSAGLPPSPLRQRSYTDNDQNHTANMIQKFRAISAPGDLHAVLATGYHIVRPVSRRPPAPASLPHM